MCFLVKALANLLNEFVGAQCLVVTYIVDTTGYILGEHTIHSKVDILNRSERMAVLEGT